jgi:hypothetical protein
MEKIVPRRFDEGWGTWHAKVYGADNEVIISGYVGTFMNALRGLREIEQSYNQCQPKSIVLHQPPRSLSVLRICSLVRLLLGFPADNIRVYLRGSSV